MNKEKQKINLIINELISFLLKNNSTEIHISIKNLEDQIQIEIYGNPDKIEKTEIEELSKKLSTPRFEDIEDLYWELVGNIHHDDELYMLGTMIDKSDIDYSNKKGIKITINRKQNN